MKKNIIIRVNQDTKNKISEVQDLMKKKTGFFIHYTEIIERAMDLLLNDVQEVEEGK